MSYLKRHAASMGRAPRPNVRVDECSRAAAGRDHDPRARWTDLGWGAWLLIVIVALAEITVAVGAGLAILRRVLP